MSSGKKKPAYKGGERRGSARFETAATIPAQLAIDLDSEVRQLSASGMLVELAIPLPPGSEHRFTLTVDRKELEMRGLVRNCEQISAGEGPLRYRLGIQFRDLDEHQRAFLKEFVAQKLNS